MAERKLRIAVVCDWLVTYAGAEKVLTEILRLFPTADLYAVVDFLSDEDRKKIGNKKAITTFIQRFPFAKNKYRTYLPFMPFAMEQLDLSDYDVIISSSHAVAKGVITGPDQLHISYVHSPIRYAWDMQARYLRESGMERGLKSFVARMMLKKIRDWDYRTANNVDFYIANSDFIGRRIHRVYRRKSTTIYPPVNIDYYTFEPTVQKKNFYLTASRLVAYKKTSLIVKAFIATPTRTLYVIGKGPDLEEIKALAHGHENIHILGYQPDEVLRKYMREARAFVYAAIEDFGIVPVEAQACGTPVIALNKGGTSETVVFGQTNSNTGVVFGSQTVESLNKALEEFENSTTITAPDVISQHAKNFSREKFDDDFKEFVENRIKERFI